MTLKKISFKNMVRASSYYAIGGIRFYDSDDDLIPILFSTKNQSTTNRFTGGATGTVNTSNSYGTYYYVDSPFDSTKVQTGGYGGLTYWLSSSANEISITFDDELDDISRIEYNPKPDASYTDRHLTSFTIELTDSGGEIIHSENIDTSSFPIDTVQSLDVSEYFSSAKMLIKSNNKVYFPDFKYLKHEIIMTSNTAPAPFVISASGVYSTSYPAWRAFDGYNDSNAWISPNGTINSWLQIDFGKKTPINSIKLAPRNYSSDILTAPKDFNILGSDDGINFTIIKEIRNQTNWALGEIREFNNVIGNNRYYRIHVLSNNGHSSYTYTTIGFVEFYWSRGLISLPNSSLDNFKKYGRSRFSRLNSVNNRIRYVLQDTVSEDVNGFWVHETDKKPLSIKFEQ